MKVLFILDTYLPKASANGICVMNLVQELQKNGDKVDCLCWDNTGVKKEIIENVQITRVYAFKKFELEAKGKVYGPQYRSAKLLDRVGTILFSFLYPNHRFFLSKRMENEALKLMKENNYDCVISVFQTFDAFYAGYHLVKKYPSIKWILYYLDVFSGGIKPKLLSQNVFYKKTLKWEKRFLSKCDRAIIMESYRKHYEGDDFKEFFNKIVYSDFPLLKINGKLKLNNSESSSEIKFLLSGKIDFAMRNPIKLLLLMETMLKTKSSHFDFCGTQDWPVILKTFQDKVGESFTYHGKVDYKTASKMEDEADVLINIGNAFSGAVPSKIFSYMSKGKIILHISSNNNDSSIPYLKEYPKSYIIYKDEKITSDTLENLTSFILLNKNVPVDYNVLSEKLEKNTPAYTTNLICKL